MQDETAHPAGDHAHHANAHDHGHGHGPEHIDEADWARMAEAAEQHGEVFAPLVERAIVWAGEVHEPAGSIRSVVDLGCGPGVAACIFAERLPTAHVTAADSSAAMRERAAARAERLGVAGRVTVAAAELPDDLSAVPHADLVWASMALHHVGDEVAALRSMSELLEPNGLIVLAEFPDGRRDRALSAMPLSIEAEAPGLQARLDEASRTWFASMRAGLAGSTQSRPLEEMVTAAGLELVGSRVERMRLDAPLPTGQRRIAVQYLQMTRHQLADYLSADDLAVLDALTDPENDRCLVHCDDLAIDVAQLIVIARRPT